jgi:hypothetical protein
MTAYISKQLNTKERPIHLWAILGAIVLLSLLYGYFLNAAIMSVVARESLQQKVSLASSEVGNLEGKLLALERPLTADAVGNYGLAVPKEVDYVGNESGTILTFGSNI